MRKQISKTCFALFACLFFVSTLSAQTSKHGRFTLSLFGGSFGGVEFLTGYRAGPSGGAYISPEWDASAQGPLVQKQSAGTFGFSIGYMVGLSARPVNDNYSFSLYGEVSYSPMVKFSDGIETRTWEDWDQSVFQFVEKSDTFLQTNRKAGMYGATMGAVWIPFARAPIGIDLGVGLWRFTQEFTSETLQFLENISDISIVTDKSANTGLSYAGQGKLERNHTALLVKIGLIYKLPKFVSFHATLRTASYFDQHESGWIYVESEEDVLNTEAHKLGVLFSAGITFHF
ncbi:MAG: hypothetical protein MUP98_07705 [Candidatus Aminicenantes bacterium]|nr:hypothetical protein [Candidatus Aminicenantes bacterium]